MASLVEDLGGAASWISRALQASGYRADFTAPSLWSIDQFVDEHVHAGRPRAGGLLADDFGPRLFALGAYTGEVIRRDLGGTWHADDADPESEVNVELRLPGGVIMWPVQRVMKRCANGAEDGIAAYGAALGLPVGPPPRPRGKRRFFGR